MEKYFFLKYSKKKLLKNNFLYIMYIFDDFFLIAKF